MEITYENICKKLGFDPLNYKLNVSSYEDDSKISPFSILTLEESLFLNDYLMNNVKLKNNK